MVQENYVGENSRCLVVIFTLFQSSKHITEKVLVTSIEFALALVIIISHMLEYL